MKWDLKELRWHVERLFGEDQVRVVQQCIRTICDRRDFSRYHYNEARILMQDALKGREDFEVTGALMGAFDTNEQQFSSARFRAYAHTLACVQSMHAVGDNLVHFAYYTLGANLDPALRVGNERDITWSNVSKKLADGPIKGGLKSLLDHPGFSYMAALSNHSKHRSIIEVGYAVSYESEEVEHGLRFNPFTYDGVAYPAKWVRETLIEEYQRQEDLILSIGNAMNAELSARR